MGQAVTGPLGEIILTSGDAFQSCWSVVMYNKEDRRGGYYHYPAGNLSGNRPDDYERTCQILNQMMLDLSPTEIHVLSAKPGPTDAGGVRRQTESDLKLLREFFIQAKKNWYKSFSEKEFHYDGEHTTIFVTLGQDNCLLIQTSSIATSGQESSMRGRWDGDGKKLPEDCTLYGRDDNANYEDKVDDHAKDECSD